VLTFSFRVLIISLSKVFTCFLFLVISGLILSKALKAQKECEDESTKIAFGNLRSEVITLRNEALEKDKILLSLVERLKTNEANFAKFSEANQKISKLEKEKEANEKRIADLEYTLSAQVELHKSEVMRLEKKLDEVTEKTLTLSNRSMRYPTLNGPGYKRMLKSFVKRRKNATLLLCNALIS
jgi:predicted RNase H-like nuclease (RuvC/YqgF family)